MSDRICSFTVTLDADYKDEDAQYILNAIKMIRGVQSVVPQVLDYSMYIAQERARMELSSKLWTVLHEEKK